MFYNLNKNWEKQTNGNISLIFIIFFQDFKKFRILEIKGKKKA